MSEWKGFKFEITLVLVFNKIESEDRKYDTFYSHSKVATIKNENDIHDVFQSIYTTVIPSMQKSLGKGSGWIIDLVIDHTISISKYNLLAGRSYIKLPKELDHPRKRLNSIQNIANSECFKWCLVRYLNPANCHSAKITKPDKYFAEKLDFKDTKSLVNVRDIHNIEKKNSIGISVFGYENKEKHPIYVSKKFCWGKHVDLLLMEEKARDTTFSSKISILSCIIILYTIEKNIFVIIVSKLSVEKQY